MTESIEGDLDKNLELRLTVKFSKTPDIKLNMVMLNLLYGIPFHAVVGFCPDSELFSDCFQLLSKGFFS